MGDKKKNPDALFRDTLTNHRIHPDERVWEQLSDRLEKRKKRVLPLWGKWAAGLVLLLALTWVFYSQTGFSNYPRQMTADEAPVQEIVPPTIPSVISPSTRGTVEERTNVIPPSPVVADRRRPAGKSSEQHQESLHSDESPLPGVPQESVRSRLEAINTPLRIAVYEGDLFAKRTLPAPNGPDTVATQTYTVRIVSRGYALQPEKEKLVDELETKIGGFISKVDEGFGDLQDAKNTLFASLTSKKERKTTK